MSDATSPTTGREMFCPTCSASYADDRTVCAADGATLVPLATRDGDPLIGQQIAGRFEVVSKLGAGGMGAVYRAIQRPIDREVALKVMNSGGDTRAAKRFIREAKLASQISHPNTVTLIDFGQTDDGSLFLAMELVEGHSLYEIMRDEGRLGPERVVDIARQVCDGLSAAHTLGIVHRDLKPGNVMVGTSGRAKVVDFGLAKSLGSEASRVTRSGDVCGTLAYIAPESARGEEAVPQSDLYALGVMMFEMLEGQLPFTADAPHALLLHHVMTPAPRLPDHYPESLRDVVARLMSKEIDERYASAAAVHAALGEALDGWVPGREPERTALPHATVEALETASDRRPPAALHRTSSGELPKIPAPRSRIAWAVAALALIAGGAWWLVDQAKSDADDTVVAAPLTDATAETKPTADPKVQPGATSVAPVAARSEAEPSNLAPHTAQAKPPRPSAAGDVPTQRVAPPSKTATKTTAAAVAPTIAKPMTGSGTRAAGAIAPTSALVAKAPKAVTTPIRFSSEPPKASVRVNGVDVCRHTPCEWTPTTADAQLRVTMRKSGYTSRTKVVATSDGDNVHLRLRRTTRRKTPKKPLKSEPSADVPSSSRKVIVE